MLITFFRALLLYLLLLFFMRLMGKRQVGQLQPFELVIMLLIADLVSSPMEDIGSPLINGVIPVVTLFIAHNAISYCSMKFPKFRTFFSGKPSVLIEKGVVNEDEMRKLNINMNDLIENLRVNKAVNIEDIAYMTIETNGQISILMNEDVSPVTPRIMNLSVEFSGMPMAVVLDGQFDYVNMEKANVPQKAVLKAFEKQNIQSEKEVFFAMVDEQGKMYFQTKGDSPKTYTAQIKGANAS